jgi:PEP-CTERM motif
VRTEIGGSELTGPVAWTTAAFDDSVFDCGVIGCFQMEVLVSFTLSAGDSLVIAGRFDVEPATVPEPATLPILGLGLAVIGLAIRKRNADSPRSRRFHR